MTERTQVLLTMGGFFAVAVVAIVVLSVWALRKRNRTAEQWRATFAQTWTGTITAIDRRPVHRWWSGSSPTSQAKDAEPRELIAVTYRRADGVHGTFHVARRVSTGRDDPGFAYPFDFSVYAGVVPPDSAPSFTEVETSWKVGDPVEKPAGAFYPRRANGASPP